MQLNHDDEVNAFRHTQSAIGNLPRRRRGPCVHEGMQFGYAQQLSAKQQGLPHEPLIADNAEALAMIRYQKFEKELREGKASEPQLIGSLPPTPVTAAKRGLSSQSQIPLPPTGHQAHRRRQ